MLLLGQDEDRPAKHDWNQPGEIKTPALMVHCASKGICIDKSRPGAMKGEVWLENTMPKAPPYIS